MLNNSHGRCILVVDDERLIRWALREALEARGYAVAEATDAVSAKSAVVDGPTPPAAVILDYRLPDSSDLGLLAAIHRHAPGAPVIMMTAHGSADMVRDALMAGAHCVVSKPFDVQHMVDLVDAAL